MRIGSIKENQNIEKRIAITPEIIKKYLSLGFEICLSKNYGSHLGITDDEYSDQGVKFANDDTNNKSIGLNLEFRITDNFTLTADYHDSSAGYKGNPGGSATSSVTFGNGCWAAWDWYPVNEASACFRNRSFDFTQSVNGNLS